MALTPHYGPFIVGTDFTCDFNVVDENGDAFDLTGATITALVETLYVSPKTMSIVNAPGTDGLARLVVTASDNSVAHGKYDGEVTIVIGGFTRKGKFTMRLEESLT